MVPWLDGAKGAAFYRAVAELAPEPVATARELAQLPPAASAEGSVAWRAFCCG